MDKKIDWVKLNNEYRGFWVALDEEETRVVAAAKEAQTAYNEAIEKGIESPILFRVPNEAISYVGIFTIKDC